MEGVKNLTRNASRTVVTFLAVAGMILTGSQNLLAADFPDGPVEMTVLFGNGSSADLTARVLADGMAKRLSSPVPVVNRTGGSGAVGYTYLKGQPADGQNIVWNSPSISTAHYSGKMRYNYKDFEAVARVSMEVPALAVKADKPWKNVNDLIKAARANPGKILIGISGKGSFTHLTSAALFAAGKATVKYVPYGRGRATAELLGGRIDAALQWPSVFKAHAAAGKLRILGVTSSERIPLLPDVPTVKEQGVDLDYVMWRGVGAPKGTPRAVIKKLEAAIRETVASPEFKAASEKIGFAPAFMGADAFAAYIAEDDKRISSQMAGLGLKKKKE